MPRNEDYDALLADITRRAELIFNALVAWRRRRAQRDRVPYYEVMQDAHLRSIAIRAPADREALLRCPGIGPKRLERYGDDILSIVADA